MENLGCCWTYLEKCEAPGHWNCQQKVIADFLSTCPGVASLVMFSSHSMQKGNLFFLE